MKQVNDASGCAPSEPAEWQSRDRMNELWREMLAWPLAERMAFSLQLAHSVLVEQGIGCLDAGLHDALAETDVYLVVGRGAAADRLKAFTGGLTSRPGAKCRVLKPGKDLTPFTAAAEGQFQ